MFLKFREEVWDLLESEYENSEAYLSKWLVNKNYCRRAAEKSLRDHKEWRKEHKIDGIGAEETGELEEVLPIERGGFDKDGRPILIFRAGRVNAKAFLNKVPENRERLGRYAVKQIEAGIQACREQHGRTNGVAHQMVGILDMAGFPVWQLASTTGISRCWFFGKKSYLARKLNTKASSLGPLRLK